MVQSFKGYLSASFLSVRNELGARTGCSVIIPQVSGNAANLISHSLAVSGTEVTSFLESFIIALWGARRLRKSRHLSDLLHGIQMPCYPHYADGLYGILSVQFNTPRMRCLGDHTHAMDGRTNLLRFTKTCHTGSGRETGLRSGA